MFNFQDYSIVDEPNDHSITNDFNSKVILNSGYSNKIKPTPVSKLNALSLNMMSIDKTITCFSIQMVSIYNIFATMFFVLDNINLKLVFF